jgi:hypothetical protein
MVVQPCGCEVVKSIVCAQGVSWRVCVAVSNARGRAVFTRVGAQRRAYSCTNNGKPFGVNMDVAGFHRCRSRLGVEDESLEGDGAAITTREGASVKAAKCVIETSRALADR